MGHPRAVLEPSASNPDPRRDVCAAPDTMPLIERNGVFEEHLPLVTSVVRQTARRHLLSHDEEDDLSSHVFLKLLEDDCRRLREFRRGSSLKTYLTVVIKRLYIDLRIQQRGKWRASAAAQRGGDIFEKIEELCYRDGYTATQAHEWLTINLGLDMTREEFDQILATLARPVSPRLEGPDSLDVLPDERFRPDAPLRAREQEQRLAHVRDAWHEFAQTLSGEDRLIWALHFDDQVKSSRIAHALGCPVEHVYSRVDRIKQLGRRHLASAGIAATFLRAGQEGV